MLSSQRTDSESISYMQSLRLYLSTLVIHSIAIISDAYLLKLVSGFAPLGHILVSQGPYQFPEGTIMELFPFSTAPRQAPGLTHPPIQEVQGVLFPGCEETGS
jgi:hypothetical protein